MVVRGPNTPQKCQRARIGNTDDDMMMGRERALDLETATRTPHRRGLDKRSTEVTTRGDHQEEEAQRLVAIKGNPSPS